MTGRTLVLLRHAKAQRPAGLADIDRPLTARGHADAAAAGAWLAQRGLLPEVVICSPAKRTRQTWHGVAVAIADAAGGTGPAVRYEPAVYSGDPGDLLDLLRDVDEAVRGVLLIGHNPTVSELSALLDSDGQRELPGLRTSGLAVHRSAGGWAACGPGAAERTESHTARA